MAIRSDDSLYLPGAKISCDLPLPAVATRQAPKLDLPTWALEHRDTISALTHRHGGVLLRGFTVGSVEDFHGYLNAASGPPLRYVERSSPRHEVGDRVYTSTDYPPELPIYLHNEQSYNITWPMRISFHCVLAPAGGGGTPLADCRKVYRRISLAARERLEARHYSYVRHFGGPLSLSWKEAFQTTERAGVEKYCRSNDIEYLWGRGDSLTTRQVRPVSALHPVTGELTWFNHLTFFHVSTLDPVLSEALLSLGEENLPNNTYYGDGADLEPDLLEELRAAYAAESVVVPWEQGDILMLDNMLTAHGREPFTGPRQIVVGMSEPRMREG